MVDLNKLRVNQNQIAGMGTVREYYQLQEKLFRDIFKKLAPDQFGTELDNRLIAYIHAYATLAREE